MRKKTYLKLVDYQTEQSEKHLNEVRSIHKEMRGYKHDFHHHLQTLKGQLEAGEIERALAYIEQLASLVFGVKTAEEICADGDAVMSERMKEELGKIIPLSRVYLNETV